MLRNAAVLMSEWTLAIDSVSVLNLGGTDDGSPASTASGDEDVEMVEMDELEGSRNRPSVESS
jgi:hypothetical protein